MEGNGGEKKEQQTEKNIVTISGGGVRGGGKSMLPCSSATPGRVTHPLLSPRGELWHAITLYSNLALSGPMSLIEGNDWKNKERNNELPPKIFMPLVTVTRFPMVLS